MMQDHLDRIRRETEAVRSQVDSARKVLEGLGQLAVPEAPKGLFEGLKGEGKEELDWDAVGRERDAEVWSATDALLP